MSEPASAFSPDPPRTPDEFVRLHTRLKLLLMAHAPAAVSRLGRIVARAGLDDLDDSWAAYSNDAADVLSRPPSRGGHVNALQHAVGYFRGISTERDRQAIVAAIDDYHHERVALELPVRLIREAAARHGVTYLSDQLYLDLSEVDGDD